MRRVEHPDCVRPADNSHFDRYGSYDSPSWPHVRSRRASPMPPRSVPQAVPRNAKAAGSAYCTGSAAIGFTGCCWRCAVASRSSQSQRARSYPRISSAEQTAKHVNRTVFLPFLATPPHSHGSRAPSLQERRRVANARESYVGAAITWRCDRWPTVPRDPPNRRASDGTRPMQPL